MTKFSASQTDWILRRISSAVVGHMCDYSGNSLVGDSSNHRATEWIGGTSH
jgi:hypothetical protein